MKRKSFITLGLISILSLSVTGCGNTTNTDSTDITETLVALTDPIENTEKQPMTLSFMVLLICHMLISIMAN